MNTLIHQECITIIKSDNEDSKMHSIDQRILNKMYPYTKYYEAAQLFSTLRII